MSLADLARRLCGEIIVETRSLFVDDNTTHAVEVDGQGTARRVLCGTVPLEDIGPLTRFTVPTCHECVRIEALPVRCPTSSPRWLPLELRRIRAEQERLRLVQKERAERQAEQERAEAEQKRVEAERAAAEAAQEQRAVDKREQDEERRTWSRWKNEQHITLTAPEREWAEALQKDWGQEPEPQELIHSTPGDCGRMHWSKVAANACARVRRAEAEARRATQGSGCAHCRSKGRPANPVLDDLYMRCMVCGCFGVPRAFAGYCYCGTKNWENTAPVPQVPLPPQTQARVLVPAPRYLPPPTPAPRSTSNSMPRTPTLPATTSSAASAPRPPTPATQPSKPAPRPTVSTPPVHLLRPDRVQAAPGPLKPVAPVASPTLPRPTPQAAPSSTARHADHGHVTRDPPMAPTPPLRLVPSQVPSPPVDYVARILAAVEGTPLHSARGVFNETGGNKHAVFETLKLMLADGRLVTDSEGAYQVATRPRRVR